MDAKIANKKLSGEISAISSKSYAHRVLIAAALTGTPVDVVLTDTSDDIEATRDCLAQLEKDAPVFDCKESGSTLRFLLPIAMALKDTATFRGSGGLPQRPLSPLKEQMEEHGSAFCQHDDEICTVTGRLTGGKYILSGSVSSQFITGLLFALPLLPESSEIILTTTLQSADYVTMTLNILEKFGIRIEVLVDEETDEETYLAFRIKGNQKYVSPGSITVEGDWSNAAFWLAAGALSGVNKKEPPSQVSCLGLDLFSSQGDRKISTIIKAFGGGIEKTEDCVTAFPGDLHGIEIDAANIPDLIPIISVIASVSSGTTKILNAERLRIKESDRLHALADGLSTLGADILELPDGLIITGKEKLSGGTVSGYNDHRIVMSMAIAALCCDTPVIIKGAEAINKSYPRFFDDFRKLGGDILEL